MLRNREISGHNPVIAAYGSFAVGISPDNHFFQKGARINATVTAKDYDVKLFVQHVRVQIVKYDYSTMTEETILDTVTSETVADGTARISFTGKRYRRTHVKGFRNHSGKSRSHRHRLDLGCGPERTNMGW